MTKTLTLDTIKKQVEKFIAETGREPHYQDFNTTHYLPSSRTVQRHFGGLVALREQLDLSVTNYTTGSTRATTAINAMERAATIEQKYFKLLHDKYHNDDDFSTDVIREYAYQQYVADGNWYRNIYSDVGIVHRDTKHVDMIDFFFPKDMYSFGGCVRIKRLKLKKHPVSLATGYTHSIYFVCHNPDITQEMIDSNGTNRSDMNILSLTEFEHRFLD